jgi:hypothetical protein
MKNDIPFASSGLTWLYTPTGVLISFELEMTFA